MGWLWDLRDGTELLAIAAGRVVYAAPGIRECLTGERWQIHVRLDPPFERWVFGYMFLDPAVVLDEHVDVGDSLGRTMHQPLCWDGALLVVWDLTARSDSPVEAIVAWDGPVPSEYGGPVDPFGSHPPNEHGHVDYALFDLPAEEYERLFNNADAWLLLPNPRTAPEAQKEAP